MIKFQTIGSDPEFVIRKGRSYLPSFMFTDGTKKEPEDFGNGYKILKDNLTIEGNIPPASSKEEFISNFKRLKAIISERVAAQKAVLVEADLVTFAPKYIFTPDGQEFGCSSYEDPYLDMTLPSPALVGYSRSCGMHIHVGYDIISDKYTQEQYNNAIAKAWDFFVTIPSDKILFTPERRNKYGKYGSYRHTSYGGEFRSLGGYFAKDEFLPWIYDQTMKVIEFVANEDNFLKLQQVESADEMYYDFLEININEQIPQLELINA
jgi:hypothetical protein